MTRGRTFIKEIMAQKVYGLTYSHRKLNLNASNFKQGQQSIYHPA